MHVPDGFDEADNDLELEDTGHVAGHSVTVAVVKTVLTERGAHVEWVIVMVRLVLPIDAVEPGTGNEVPETAGDVSVPRNVFEAAPRDADISPGDVQRSDRAIEADPPGTKDDSEVALRSVDSDTPKLAAKMPWYWMLILAMRSVGNVVVSWHV
jgi:hypothetical protein